MKCGLKINGVNHKNVKSGMDPAGIEPAAFTLRT